MCVLQPGHRLHHRQLGIERQAGRDAVRIDLVRPKSLGLKINLVRGLVGKTMDLVLDRRAVTRSDTLDHPGKQRRAVQRQPDDLVGALIGVRHPARQLPGMLIGVAEEGEHRHRITVARLFGQTAVIDRLAIDARRGARLQAPLRKRQLAQACGERPGRRIARPAGLIIVQADMHLAIEEGAGGQHHRMATKDDAQLSDDTCHAVAFQQQIIHRLLKQGQVGLILQGSTDCLPIENPIGLRARCAHGWTLAGIQDAKLDASMIRGNGHDAAKRIHLFHQMALADAPDRRVARHLPQSVKVVA